MGTRRLYYEDPSMREFRARVTSVSGRELILEATAFFPGGGGQEPDRGEIAGALVVDVKKRGREIVHLGESDWMLAAGLEVEGKIDWERRHALMRAHTAEHLLMGELQRRFGAEIEKVAIGPGGGTLFLKGGIGWDQVAEAQRAVNGHIRAGLKAEAREMPVEEARAIPGVRISVRLEGKEKLRILDIAGVDRAACAGIHLHDTSEIVALLVTSINVRGGEAQLSFVTGWEAITSALDDSLTLGKAASVINSARNDLAAAVAGLADANEDLLTALRSALLNPPKPEMMDGVELFAFRVDGAPARLLGEIAGRIAKAGERRIVIIDSVSSNPFVAVACSGMPDLDCGRIVKEACVAAGGGGGGNRELGTGSAPRGAEIKLQVGGALRMIK